MNGHDPLCRAYYQMHMNANICRSCDLIRAVREDQNKIRPSGRLMFQTGYDSGIEEVRKYALSLLNTELHLINEEIVIEAIVDYIDSIKQIND